MSSKWFRCAVAAVAAAMGSFVLADTPEFFVDQITSDAKYDPEKDAAVGGGINTRYFYKGGATSYPRTTKVSFSYKSYNTLRAPGETDRKMRSIFGVWNTTHSCFRKSDDATQFWSPGLTSNFTTFSGGLNGANVLEIDYLTTNVWLNGTSKVSKFNLPTAKPTQSDNDYKLVKVENCNYSYLDIYGFQAWEKADAGSEPALAMNLVPCCAEGCAAMYDTIGKTVLFPTSRGYTLPLTNDVTVADGGKFYATPLTVGQKSVTFMGGATLYFDGSAVIDCSDPKFTFNSVESSAFTVNVTATDLSGELVLFTGITESTLLPEFALGTMPSGYTGRIVRETDRVVVKVGLVVAAGGTFYVTPETIGYDTVKFEGDARLVFDGTTALPYSSDKYTFDQSDARLYVDMPNVPFRSESTLMTGLQLETALPLLRVGEMPLGYKGELVRNDSTLVLRLTPWASAHPEAIAESVRGDGNGYIPTGYFIRATKSPRTRRAAFTWSDDNCGKGKAPGPTCDNAYAGVFGVWDDGFKDWRFGARYNNGSFQPVANGNNWYGSIGFFSGEQTLDIDLGATTNQYVYHRGNGTTVEWTPSALISSDDVNEIYVFGQSRSGERFVRSGKTNDVEWVFDKGSVYDFKRLKIWDQADGEEAVLARDFVPCWNSGKAAIYDMVTGVIKYPVADTNGFTAANLKWRVSANGQFAYHPAGDVVTLTLPEGVPAYKVVRDSDGTVIAQGSGTSVSFTMPEGAVTVRSLVDANVGAGETLELGQTTYYRSLAFAAGARLSLAAGAAAVIDGTLALPTDGTVTIDLSGVTGMGVYPVMEGVADEDAVGKFEVGALASGYDATVEKWGDKLVLRVGYDMKNGTPLFVKTIKTDGVGWIDTKYYRHFDKFPKTSRVRAEAYSENYSRAPGSTAATHSFFGNWNSLMNAVRWSGESLQMWHSLKKREDGTYTGNGNGTEPYATAWVGSKKDIIFEFDYLQGVPWVSTDGEKTKDYFGGALLAAETTVSPSSMWLFGVKDNNRPGVYTFKEFRVWEADVNSNETLAVDMVPCLSAGKAAVYDKARKQVFLPTCAAGTNTAFTVTDYGFDLEQRFARVKVTCPSAFGYEEFGPQTRFTFTKDATIEGLKRNTQVTVAKYEANGTLVNETTTLLNAGVTMQVKLGNVSKLAVVTVSGAGSLEQDFGPVKVVSAEESLYRSYESKRSGAVVGELMIAADATVTFKAHEDGLAEIVRYDADGAELSTETLKSMIVEGETLAVTLGDGVAYAVIRVRNKRRGFGIIIR